MGQLEFVFESIFDFFLSSLPVDSVITVTAWFKDGFVITEISAPLSEKSFALVCGKDLSARDRLVGEMFLGKGTVERFLRNHGGSLSISDSDQNVARFTVKLPTTKV